MDYYAEEAKKRIENNKHKCDVLAKAWANVKRVKTKSGEDFKTLSKNFTGASVKPKTYTPSEKEICVYATDGKYNNFNDSIDLERTIFHNSEEAEKYKDRLIERGAWLHPYIELTIDEIIAEINKRIDYYAKRSEELGEELADFDDVASKVVAMRQEAEAFIKQHDIIYYELRSILREERL